MARLRGWLLLAVGVTLASCGAPATTPDGGTDGGTDGGAGVSDGGDGAGGGDGGSVDSGTDDGGTGGGSPDAGPVDAGQPVPDPVLFVHGVNGSASNWDTVKSRLVADGWPADRLMARTFSDPAWGCNVDNANTVKQWADELLATTGANRLDVVAHSMGTLSSRRYMKQLGGHQVVNTYVTLGGMNHGLLTPCFSPLPVCVWQELCASGQYIAELNAAPATQGPAIYVSIFGDADTTVPNSSSQLDGGENILMPGVEHSGATGLQEDLAVYREVRRVLQYPGH